MRKWKISWKYLDTWKNWVYSIKDLAKQSKMKQKSKKNGFLDMLLGTLGASLLENILAGKEVIPAGEGTSSFNQ